MILITLFLNLLILKSTYGLKVLHLADFHMDVRYSTKGNPSDMCHGQNSTKTLGSFGDYMCDSPQAIIFNYSN